MHVNVAQLVGDERGERGVRQEVRLSPEVVEAQDAATVAINGIPAGRVIAFGPSRGNGNDFTFTAVNTDGTGRSVLRAATTQGNRFAVSADGRKIAYNSADANRTVHIYDTVTRADTPISTVPYTIESVAWSPDGTKLAIYGGQGTPSLWTVNIDGSHATRIGPGVNNGSISGISLAPNGRTIYYGKLALNGTGEIWAIGADGTGNQVAATAGKNLAYPVVSPDGTMLAWVILGGPATNGLITASITGANRRRLLSTYAYSVDWSKDGKNLIYAGEKQGAAPDWNDLWVIDLNGAYRGKISVGNMDVQAAHWRS